MTEHAAHLSWPNNKPSVPMYLEVGVHFYSSEWIDSAGFSPACFILQTKNSSKDHFFMNDPTYYIISNSLQQGYTNLGRDLLSLSLNLYRGSARAVTWSIGSCLCRTLFPPEEPWLICRLLCRSAPRSQASIAPKTFNCSSQGVGVCKAICRHLPGLPRLL